MFFARNCRRFIPLTRFYGLGCSTNSLMQKRTPTLYGDEVSPPVRFVLMTASYLGIKLDFHKIDLFLAENKTEFYTKINPLQKVPALDTGKVVIRDSHAIALYLCREAGPNNLYPEETELKAKVHELLFFNSSNLFPIDSIIFTDYFAGKPVDSNKVEQWYKLLDIMESRLKAHAWLVGEHFTLGDFCCAATISSLGVLIPLTDRHVNIREWMKRLEQIPCFEINSYGLKSLSSMVGKNRILK